MPLGYDKYFPIRPVWSLSKGPIVFLLFKNIMEAEAYCEYYEIPVTDNLHSLENGLARLELRHENKEED